MSHCLSRFCAVILSMLKSNAVVDGRWNMSFGLAECLYTKIIANLSMVLPFAGCFSAGCGALGGGRDFRVEVPISELRSE